MVDYFEQRKTVTGVYYAGLVRKLGEAVEKKRPGSGRRRSARTEKNVETVKRFVFSQEDNPQTHWTVPKISQKKVLFVHVILLHYR